MLMIDSNGVVVDARVRRAISPALERGDMKVVNGIIVHQTSSPTAASTLNGYKPIKDKPKPSGAHFLIDKDGTIYQTASVYKQAPHVGILKSRCISERKCSPAEFKTVSKLKIHKLSTHEKSKSWPDRYPSNKDAIGIEIVGKFLLPPGRYEAVTSTQNASLKWLITEISLALGVPMAEVFRHPDVSYKQESEAETAQW